MKLLIFLSLFFACVAEAAFVPMPSASIPNAVTNYFQGISISSRGIINGKSVHFNDGASYGPDTTGTTTSGIQEALNSIPSPPGTGTNTGGALLNFGPGDFFFTNNIYFTNNHVMHLRLQGASFLTSRLIYAGALATNAITFTGGTNGYPSGLNIPLHFSARDLTFTALTNGNFTLLRVTNYSHLDIEYCNFTGWNITTNTDWGPGVSISGFHVGSLLPYPGNVGMTIGNVNDHGSFVKNCYFAYLATGIEHYTDHFYAENIKFALIGYGDPAGGGGGSAGTPWPNTSAYSLGAAFLIHGLLDSHIFRTHFYVVNGGIVMDHPNGSGTVGAVLLKEPQWESADHALAATGLTQDISIDEVSSSDDGPSSQYKVNHSPYAYASGPFTIGLRRAVYNPWLLGLSFDMKQNQITNVSTISASYHLTVSNAYPITSWAQLGNCGCIEWMSNATLYKICTNSINSSATTNKIAGL